MKEDRVNVADALILSSHGVRREFGIPGEAIRDVTKAVPDPAPGRLLRTCHAAMAHTGVVPPTPTQRGDGPW